MPCRHDSMTLISFGLFIAGTSAICRADNPVLLLPMPLPHTGVWGTFPYVDATRQSGAVCSFSNSLIIVSLDADDMAMVQMGLESWLCAGLLPRTGHRQTAAGHSSGTATGKFCHSACGRPTVLPRLSGPGRDCAQRDPGARAVWLKGSPLMTPI